LVILLFILVHCKLFLTFGEKMRNEDFIFNLEYLRHVKHVFVPRTPVYNYVKTPSSLSNQAFSAAKVIRMKATVFEYYRQFYKEAFTGYDYEKNRFHVYSFFISAAADGRVPFKARSRHAAADGERPSVRL